MISVIVPTYNRSRTLLQSLHSLQEQKLSEFEIIVVDNAADPKVERSVKELNQTAKVTTQYVPEPKLGLHHARHAGARAARGDVLVFTDDDATYDSGWLQAYAEAFESHPEMVAAGGPIRPVWEAPPPQWLLDYMAREEYMGGNVKTFGFLSLMDMYDEFRLDPRGYFYGVNMAIRREVLFEVGGFNPEAVGDIWLGDGETGLNRKLWGRGLLIGYVPEAVVYHHIPPQRMTAKYFRHRMANEGACEIYSDFHHGLPSRLRLCKHAAAVTVKNSKLWAAALLLRGKTDARSLRFQTDAARTQSRLKYAIRLILDKNLRQLVLKKDWLNEPSASVPLRPRTLRRR
jgi:glycosyltransferase involved in cell wall biosynthesis